ncbi:MAG: hypothetical protein ACQESC_01910 [Nanobdellota archaeon]
MKLQHLFRKVKDSTLLRFVFGLAIFFILLGLIASIIVALLPIIVSGAIFIGLIILFALGVVMVLGLFTAIWYVSRKEPPLSSGIQSDNKEDNYTLSQSKSR